MDTGLFFFLAVAAASLFSFIAVATWAGARYAERETYYRSELIKKAMESPSAAGLDYLRERDREAARRAALKTRSGIRLGGLIAVAAGIGLMVFLNQIAVFDPSTGAYYVGGERNVYLFGLIPILVGVTLFGYSFFSPRE